MFDPRRHRIAVVLKPVGVFTPLSICGGGGRGSSTRIVLPRIALLWGKGILAFPKFKHSPQGIIPGIMSLLSPCPRLLKGMGQCYKSGGSQLPSLFSSIVVEETLETQMCDIQISMSNSPDSHKEYCIKLV